MMNRLYFKAFERTSKDIIKSQSEENIKKLFGRKVVLGGDFRQILPIVKKGSR